MTCKLTNFVFIKFASLKSLLRSSSRLSSRFSRRSFSSALIWFRSQFLFFQLLSLIINNDSLFFFSSFELTFFQQHSQYQISNLVKKLMKMNDDIVVLRRNTKNILRKFSKMKKRISFLKRRIITNETQLKRVFFFFFSLIFWFFFRFFFWFRFFSIIIIILYVLFLIITFIFFRNSYALSRSFVRSSTRSFAFFSSKELIVFAFKTINEKTNKLLNKFDFLHEIMNENIEWLKSNFVL
jgi:hypothetical protein